LLYTIHPALRVYLEDISSHNLESEYGEKYSNFYYNLAWEINDAHLHHISRRRPAIAHFDIIFRGETNDFDRAAELATDKTLKAENLRALSQILSDLDDICHPIWMSLYSSKRFHLQPLNHKSKSTTLRYVTSAIVFLSLSNNHEPD
jgi:hypothetical protein